MSGLSEAAGPATVGGFAAFGTAVGAGVGLAPHAAKIIASAVNRQVNLSVLIDMVHFLHDEKCANILPL